MTIASFFQGLAETGVATSFRESTLAYPIVMSLHLTSIAVFGGMILMTDLRLLGMALRDYPAAEVIRGLRPWKRAGFVVMVTCGLMLGLAKADKYYSNPYFLLKMTLLALTGVHAVAFRAGVYGRPERLDEGRSMPGAAKAAAWISLILWVGILSAGRWIAYYEPPRPSAASEQVK
jgi:hypothetical protein